jgi:hypothetical protein
MKPELPADLTLKIQSAVPLLKRKLGFRWALATACSIVETMLSVLMLGLFPVMFMGFYRFAGADFPIGIRIFAMLFFGGVLTFILAAVVEQSVIRKMRFIFPQAFETALSRWLAAVVSLVPVYALSWEVAVLLFQNEQFSFSVIVRWGGLLGLMMIAALIRYLASRIVMAYLEALEKEVLVPLVSSYGWKRTPAGIDVPESFIAARFPYSVPASCTVTFSHVVVLEKGLIKVGIGNSSITEQTVSRGKSSRSKLFTGTLVQIQAGSVSGIEGIWYGSAFGPAKVDAVTPSDSDGPDTAISKLLTVLEQGYLCPVVLVSASGSTWLQLDGLQFPASGILPPKAWDSVWIENAVHLLYISVQLVDLVTPANPN